MKVVCDRAALVEALALAGSVVPTRTTAPVLGCLALTAEDGVLTVAATNAEVGLTLGVAQVDIQSAGTALVPSDKLTQIVRACEDTTLTLELEKSMLNGQKLQGTITAKDVMVVLQSKNLAKEFPLFTRIHEIAFEGKAPSSIVEL